MSNYQKFRVALDILEKHNPDDKWIFGADHDIIYSNLEGEQVPEDSEDGQKLIALGWHLSTEFGYWYLFV